MCFFLVNLPFFFGDIFGVNSIHVFSEGGDLLPHPADIPPDLQETGVQGGGPVIVQIYESGHPHQRVAV